MHRINFFKQNPVETAENFIATLTNKEELGKDELFYQTVDYLVKTQSSSYQNASITTAKAIANIEANRLKHRAYVDLNHSTSACVFVCLDGHRRAVSLVDLVHLLDQST